MHKVKLASLTCEMPSQSFGNEDKVFDQLPEMSNRWWRFWGIEKRGYFRPENGESELKVAQRVVSRLLDRNGLAPGDIDLLLCSASCPIMTDDGRGTQSDARLYPRLATALKQSMNLNRALHMDTQMECASFLLNLRIAASFVQQGLARNVIVVCSEYISNMLDFTARSATIFADGCAGALITRSDDESDLLSATQHSRADHYDIATAQWRFHENDPEKTRAKLLFTLEEEGQSKMQEFVPDNVPIAVNRALSMASLTTADIDHFVFHQPSPILLHAWASGVGCPEEKFTTTMDKTGVVVSVSIPFTLYTALKENKIPEGGTVVLAGAATGWGFAAQVWKLGKMTLC
ncbi:3-oxoacyl-ACP synthase III family protein [Photobacterium sp. 1_MG-2023]|uniref:3-oxoacyl-ACP synthase III family protein n=1 Tax=Photobacterium sp. 1_MG-2023 TaxID=3062646 RepID=UPI0026E334A5|nr:3-oxoacyl-ACP synthase III family protein [Photobacterium sp. 1_MG-2023]MDO6708155.1 3-oxoacyl-ACP synthase III family protein [Photobacterium sp. 1_MG-2023]